MLPIEPVRADAMGGWSAGELAAGASLIDNAYAGWARSLTIDQAWCQLTLAADGANILHLCRPPGEPFSARSQ